MRLLFLFFLCYTKLIIFCEFYIKCIRRVFLKFMVKELKNKTDKLESVKDSNPNLNSNSKSLKPKANDVSEPPDLSDGGKDLSANKSMNNSNESITDGPPQLDSSGFDSSYMDGFTDDTSGWMADKLEDGIRGVGKGSDSSDKSDTSESGKPGYEQKYGNDPNDTNVKDAHDNTTPINGENSELNSDGDTSEPESGDSEQGNVDSQNSSNNRDAISIDVGDDEPEDDNSETTLDKIKNFAKNALFKNKAVRTTAKTFGFFVSLLTGAGVPTAAAAAIVATTSLGIITAVGVTGAAIAVNDATIKDEKTVKIEDCDDKEKSMDAAIATAAVNDGLSSAEQEEHVRRIHSVLSEWGLSDIQIAGVVGNGAQESGLDPRKFESDHVAGGKYKTEENYNRVRNEGPLIENIFGSWGTFASYYNSSSGLDEEGYRAGAPEGKHTLGIGVWQWTGAGAMGLYKFAKDKNIDMWSLDTQLKFMLSSFSNKASYYHRLEKFKSLKSATPEQAALDFLNYWEYEAGSFKANDGTYARAEVRMQRAAYWYVKIKEMSTDKEYAKSILSAVVREASVASDAKVSSTSEAYHDCVNDSKGFGGTGWQKKGGTFSGANGSGLAWKYDELPDELKQYAIDPRSLGMKFGEEEGWTIGGDGYVNAGYCNQCTSLSSSLTGVLWEKNGQPIGSKHGMHGNGQDIVKSMASALGVKIRKEPISGDVFSQVGGKYGHTGIVSHVFENGDILVIEQNYGGKSGGSRFGDYESLDKGKYEWSYRYISKSQYERDHEFASPEGAGYKISSKAKSMK